MTDWHRVFYNPILPDPKSYVGSFTFKTEEVEMSEGEYRNADYEYQGLYEVVTTYGGNRNDVEVVSSYIVADDEQRARMRARDDIDASWDEDYISQCVNKVGSVRVRLRPKEVLSAK